MKAPERMYIDGTKRVIQNMAFTAYSFEFLGHVEYIRKDIAEQMAKEFAEFVVGGEYSLCEDGIWLGHSDDSSIFEVHIDKLFNEFINSRNAETEQP